MSIDALYLMNGFILKLIIFSKESINKKGFFLLISLNLIKICFISNWDNVLLKFIYFSKFFIFNIFKNTKKEMFWKNFLLNGSFVPDSFKISTGKKINLIISTMNCFCISIILLSLIKSEELIIDSSLVLSKMASFIRKVWPSW